MIPILLAMFAAPMPNTMQLPKRSGRVIVEFTAPARVSGGSVSDLRALHERFRSDVSAMRAAKYGKRGESAVVREFSTLLAGAAVVATADEAARMRKLPYVARVTPDVVFNVPADEPNLDQVNAPKVWSDLGTRGAGITVAVIDTGIDYTHPALGGGFGPGFKVIGGHDYGDGDDDPMDELAHGTHVAGIIAANGPENTGVAPEAKLIAYKVFNASGDAYESEIVAALEAAVDPNGDGDTRDHVDVANLSLGGPGGADDPLSAAVDRAVAAGVVVCVAAGNHGTFHSISSPGAARDAITVGALGLDLHAALFSSGGPAAGTLAMKPDVLAPGTSIRSTGIGGGSLVMSGTSMASPHVAGAAALLLALHRDWTPRQVKSALMTTAHLVDGSEAMTQGGGAIDAYAAAGVTTEVAPASLSFGAFPAKTAAQNRNASVTVANHGASPQTYDVTFDSAPAGVSLTADVTHFTLAGGESRQIVISLSMNGAALGARSWSHTYSGEMRLTTAATTQHVPWAFVDGLRVVATSDGGLGFPMFIQPPNGAVDALLEQLDDDTYEAIVDPGTYDVLGVGLASHLYYLPAQQIAGETTISMPAASAQWAIEGAAVDEQGRRLASRASDTAAYLHVARIVFPPEYGIPTLLTAGGESTLHTTAFPRGFTILPAETLLDSDAHTMYSVQEPPLDDVAQNLTQTNATSDFHRVPVSVRLPRGCAKCTVHVAANFSERAAGTPELFYGISGDVGPEPWSGVAYLTKPQSRDYSVDPVVFAEAGSTPLERTPPIRWWDDGAAASQIGVDDPLERFSAGAPLSFGDGFVYSTPAVAMLRGSVVAGVSTFGEHGDSRGGDSAAATAAVVHDASGETVTVDGPPYAAGGAMVRSHVVAKVDSRRADYQPPVVTGLALVDERGFGVSRITNAGATRLAFSAADVASAGTSGIDVSSVKAFWRRSETDAWQTLALTPNVTSGKWSAELTPVGNAPAPFEIRIDLADLAGNSSSMTLPLAIEAATRHRATAH
jgi:subtilisin family serine protease